MNPEETQMNQDVPMEQGNNLDPNEAAATLAFMTNLSEQGMRAQMSTDMPEEMPTEEPMQEEVPEEAPVEPEIEPEEEETDKEEDNTKEEIEGLKSQISKLEGVLEERDKKHSKDLEDIKKAIKEALND